ncbi:MAG TPA: hypothetical protein VJ715_16390 [Pyrinomonadaceae bacterium]|nr:hypothetical protein [Pyrinomonadaceae bacterium]
MKKIDRLGWAAGISFISHGVRVGVRVNRPDALALVEDYLPPGWKPSASHVVERLYSLILGQGDEAERGSRRFSLFYRDLVRLARTKNLEEALALFESDLHLHVATEARRRIFVHAGVVGWKGRALVIPGRSRSGKTTLVAELVKAGAVYYSDEYAVLDERGRVHPYPRPLQIRTAGTGEQRRHSVETLGGRAGSGPLPVALVVASRYRPEAKWRPRRLSAGQGVLELLAQTVSARNQPEKAFATLEQVATRALILKGTRGEASEMVEPLLRQMGG